MNINDLREICDKKLSHYEKKKNKSQIALFTTIKNILTYDNAFFKLDMAVSLNILRDLGFNEDEATLIFKDLLI